MKIVDANVLIYAVNDRAPAHEVARRWLLDALCGTEPVGLPWVSLLAFIRLTTSRQIFTTPLSIGEAMALVESWVELAVTIDVPPTARHTAILRGLLEQAGAAGNLTTDAHLAALAIEHGASIVSFDRDFERFGMPLVVPT